MPPDVPLGPDPAISRKHAVVFLRKKDDSVVFKVKIIGRNGMILNEKYYPRGSCVELREKVHFRISNFTCTFQEGTEGSGGLDPIWELRKKFAGVTLYGEDFSGGEENPMLAGNGCRFLPGMSELPLRWR
mmetsp:Transcript_24316/g.58686  ORF Transcript_24316/g.58686 Transcript_24316/m.58686 type:complete len:130 (+) Transcript_24316:385-774(+)